MSLLGGVKTNEQDRRIFGSDAKGRPVYLIHPVEVPVLGLTSPPRLSEMLGVLMEVYRGTNIDEAMSPASDCSNGWQLVDQNLALWIPSAPREEIVTEVPPLISLPGLTNEFSPSC